MTDKPRIPSRKAQGRVARFFDWLADSTARGIEIEPGIFIRLPPF